MVQKAVQLELRLAVGMTSHGSRRMASAAACVLQVSATVVSAWNFVQKPRVFNRSWSLGRLRKRLRLWSERRCSWS